MTREEAGKRMSDLNWQGEKSNDCSALLDYCHWHWRFGHYDKIDIMLYNIDLNASTSMLVWILRFTCQVYKNSSHLPSWPKARDKIYTEIMERQLDADDLLQGLM